MLRLVALLLTVALCGSACAQTLPIDGRVDVSALEAKITAAHDRARLAEEKADELLRRPVFAPTTFDLVAHGGCKLNDASFDNGPIINAIVKRIGSNAPAGSFWPDKADGWINCKLTIPNGRLYFKTPLDLGTRSGLSIEGVGPAMAQDHNADWAPNPNADNGGSRLVYVGPADKAVRVANCGTTIVGVTFQRGDFAQPVWKTKIDAGSVGLFFDGRDQPPVGKALLVNVSFFNWDTGILAGGTTHADESDVPSVTFWNCNTGFKSTQIQALGWRFGTVRAGWNVPTIFDVMGDLVVDDVQVMWKSLVLRCLPQMNVGNYVIHNVHFDNGSAGWRLIETTAPWAARLRVSGYMQNGATPGKDPVKLGKQFTDVQIDIHNSGTGQPWEWGAK